MISLREAIKDVPPQRFVTVPLKDWSAALSTAKNPDKALTIAELRYGANRAKGNEFVGISAEQIQLVIDSQPEASPTE